MGILAEQANQLCVDESSVDSDLVLDKFDEGLPDFGSLAHRVSHHSLRVACCLLLKLFRDNQRLFRDVRGDLTDQILLREEGRGLRATSSTAVLVLSECHLYIALYCFFSIF